MHVYLMFTTNDNMIVFQPKASHLQMSVLIYSYTLVRSCDQLLLLL